MQFLEGDSRLYIDFSSHSRRAQWDLLWRNSRLEYIRGMVCGIFDNSQPWRDLNTRFAKQSRRFSPHISIISFVI